MESGAVELGKTADPDSQVQSNCSKASLRRRAWAHSKDSTWHESDQEQGGPQGPKQGDGDAQKPSEEPGQVPNKITSWLIECRTPIGASLDDQSASPSRGALRNGCSFEDDLSLGAEANHLQSTVKKPDPCFGLAAEDKRSQFKERGRSMNSTGSGKSSTVSSVSELLDLYEEDPEEILFNLGFGREEPDLASKVPSRFFNSSSAARGIDIKVYLGAQMQRMELENPNYALTSRFRQIEVLTTVANEFFQLYSQVSGQPVQCIATKEHGIDGEQAGSDEPPPLKRASSARNVAKFLKRTITKHNLLAAPSESPEAQTAIKKTQMNGHAHSDHTQSNGHSHDCPEQESSNTSPDHQVDIVNSKYSRKKESGFLATVTEENSADGETESLTENSPEQSPSRPVNLEEHPPESDSAQIKSGRTEDESQIVTEKSLTSTPVKAPHTLAPPQLALLRTEKTDSFDMEEIQSNDDEGLPHRTSRAADLSRTVSQQSDSSGFAEEPSADSNGYLKIQESCDSCDSETTVTSHPSQDVATPLAVDQSAFDLPDGKEEEWVPCDAVEVDGRNSFKDGDEDSGTSEHVGVEGRSSSREEEEDNESSEHVQVKERSSSREEEEDNGSSEHVEMKGRSSSREEEEDNGSSEHVEVKGRSSSREEGEDNLQQFPQYTAHYFPQNRPMVTYQGESEETLDPSEEGNWSEPGQEQRPTLEEHQSESEKEKELEPAAEQGTTFCVEQQKETKTELGVKTEHAQQITQKQTISDTVPPTKIEEAKDRSQDEPAYMDSGDECSLPVPSSPVLSALYRARRNHQCRTRVPVTSSEKNQGTVRGRGKRSIPLQRSSSLPSSIISPTRVVSSVRIQFGQGQSSCTQPTYSYKFIQKDADVKEEIEGGNEESRSTCTLLINPVSPTGNKSQMSRLAPDNSVPPKPIPRYLLRSPCSLTSSSPPTDWSLADQAPSWSSQSIPDLSSNLHSPAQIHHNSHVNHSWNPGNLMFPHPGTTPTPPYTNPLPNPPSLNPSMYPGSDNLPYPSPLQPYASLPILENHYSHPIRHHSSMSSLHQPPPPSAPLHASLSNLHHASTSSSYPNINVGNQHPKPSFQNPQVYNHPFSPQASNHGTSQASQFSLPYGGYHGYNPNPPMAFPQPAPHQYTHHGLPTGQLPPAPGFLPDLTSAYGQAHSFHPGFPHYPCSPAPGPGPSQVLSSTEMQLRKVLHDIRGTLQSLNQNRANTPDMLGEGASFPSSQSLAEFQQKRQCLNLFRSQMMDLELSVMRQQALVYKHLSPSDRLEVEHLQSLRTAIREQLQELEQQMEEKLAQHRVSDLLREQFSLQSELSYDGNTPSTNVSTRSSTPILRVRRDSGSRQGVYRASINITPVPPPRGNTHVQEEEVQMNEEGSERGGKAPEEGLTGGRGVTNDSLQQLIREIRESVAQEVRQEIYSELLAAVTPRDSPLPNRQKYL
ncbi:sperm-specific antigen 2 homolog isoform X2 [Cynoglossus semilaevis]|uniref:sperm-specific antigen 2 homolog isoform X2 n=1 Tax=Cynoglossus semilaevis TaxID=244447 RepID=UPI00049553D9|nr:sperm-specific antigen 2 isoform X2 [Cynoglossus semilaevis]